MSFLRKLFAVLFLSILFASAHTLRAQVSVYGTGTSAFFGFSGQSYTGGTQLKPSTTGFLAGTFYSLRSLNRFHPGLDVRYTSTPGYNGGHAYTGGVRFAWVPYRFPLRPYGEFGGGLASTQLHQSVCALSCSTTTTRLTSGVVQFGAGLDVHLYRLFDLRAIDFQYDTGGAAGMTHAAMHSLSSGIVVHLPSRAPNNR